MSLELKRRFATACLFALSNVVVGWMYEYQSDFAKTERD